MRRLMWVVPAVFTIVAAAAVPAQAQVMFGPHVAWGDDTDLAVGGRIGFNVPAGDGVFSRLQIFGAFDYFLDPFDFDDASYFEITPFGRVPVAISEGLDTYLGAGLNIARFSYDTGVPGVGDVDDTEVGLAVLGGIEFLLGALDAFGELRLTLSGAEQLVVSFGFLFGGN